MESVRPQTGRRGFTLVELLVVIVIIAILAGLLLPVIAHAIRRAQVANCQSNLSQLGKCLALYRTQNKGKAPREIGQDFWIRFQETVPPLISERQKDVMSCPLVDEEVAYGETHFRGPGQTLGRMSSDDPLGADLEGNHGPEEGGNVLLMDGSVQEVPLDHELWEACALKLLP